MTIPFWCLVIVMFMPIPLALAGAAERRRSLGRFDNKLPRVQVRELEGRGARLYGAQANGWEATILFGTTVIVTHLAGLDPAVAAPWTIAFVALRVLFTALYLLDYDMARSAVFGLCTLCLIALLVQAA